MTRRSRLPVGAAVLAAAVLFTALLLTAGCGTPQKPSPSASGSESPAAMAKRWSQAPAMQIDTDKQYAAVLVTDKGTIRIELFTEQSPRTVNNFVFLSREGFYDGVIFHRVIEPFMIQTGDPKGDGTGGPGYRFADELPPPHPYEPGIVAMANAGPNTNGSQFFICSGPSCRNLDRMPNYTQFGRVVEGMDVVQKIAAVPVGPGHGGEMSRPAEQVRIQRVTIEEQ